MPIINSVITAGGITPSGTKSITTNGTHDVTNFASADVQVPTTAPTCYIEKIVDASGKIRTGGNSIINLNGATSVSGYGLAYNCYAASFPENTSIDLSSLTNITEGYACLGTFAYCSGITNVDLSGLITVSGGFSLQYMFQYCPNLISADLSSLTTLSGTYCCSGTFQNCSHLTSVELSSLTTISGPYACSTMFASCPMLESAEFNSLTTITGNEALGGMFSNCTNLKSVKFDKLSVIDNSLAPSYSPTFNNSQKLEYVSFGGVKSTTFANKTTQFQYLFSTLSSSQALNGCTVHFPSNFDPSDPNHTFDASTLTGYPTFGGNASYIHIAFDLPATE